MNAAPSLIHLDNVSKVFYTDEVETHALDDVTLDIFSGEYFVPSWARIPDPPEVPLLPRQQLNETSQRETHVSPADLRLVQTRA